MPLNNPYSSSPASTSTTSATIAASTTSAILLAANPARKGASFWNNSNNNLFIDLDESASAANHTAKLIPQGYYELPFNYVGAISGIWDGTSGGCFVREFL